MMTPEGKVKAIVKRLLDNHKVYYFMPVQTGIGAPGLDFHCIHNGHGMCIETKAPGKKPTPRQEVTITKIQAAKGLVFVVDGSDESVEPLARWLKEHAQCT